MDFAGKVALVTGGGSGIGEAAARQLGARGAQVVVADVVAEQAERVASAITEPGGAAFACTVDVADEASVDAMVRAAVERFGRLDCACNAAGISPGAAAFHETSLDSWNRVVAVNLTGVFLSMRAELAQLVAQGSGGAIVNVSSGAGVVASPGQPQYTAAKHGVLGLTKVAAAEYARNGIRVNAVLPGTTDTPMLRRYMDENPGIEKFLMRSLPTGRLGQADEIAAAIVWLCSDAASFVSGDSMLVDGGQVCR
ncbi:MAG TPA: glucose 1-dehydrogenase [Acidimicrobiia bacterium]|nr:glucose 1-dehydrogenase [Acidimicrobiia bacterium]